MGGFSGLRNPFFTQRPQDAFFNPNLSALDPTAVPASPNSMATPNAQPPATTPAAEQPPKMQPAAADPATAGPGGTPIVAPSAAPTGPLTRDAFFQANPDATKAFVPPRPVGELDDVHGIRKALAMAFAGLASFGAGLNHREDPTLSRWTGQGMAERQYDANLPHLQAEAQNQAYQRYQGEQSAQAGIEHSEAETQNLKQNSPAIQRKAQFLAQLQGEAESGKYDPDALKARALRMARAGNVIVDPTEIDDVIQNTKALGSKYQVQQDKNGRPELITDRQGNRIFPDANGKFADPEAQSQWDSISQAHAKSIEEETTKEQRVAGYAAQRQGASIGAAIKAAQVAEENKTVNSGRAAALKHLEDLRSAQNQNDLVQQLASSKSPTDQTSLAFKALGLDLPEGVHRINDTELNAIRNQGGLSDRAERALLNWKSGQQFAPEILQDISQTAQKIAQSKVKNANDNLEDVNRVYGYRAKGADERGRFDASPQGAEGAGGGGIQVKAPDGSIHTFPNQASADNFKKLAHIQ